MQKSNIYLSTQFNYFTAVKMPKGHRNTFQRGGGNRRGFECRCGWRGMAYNKKDADSIAKRHAKICPHFREYLDTILAMEMTYKKGRPDESRDWHTSRLMLADSIPDPNPPVSAAEPVSLGAIMRSGDYMPGDNLIDRRVARGLSGPLSAADVKEVHDELDLYRAAHRKFFFYLHKVYLTSIIIFVGAAASAAAPAAAPAAAAFIQQDDDTSTISMSMDGSQQQHGKAAAMPNAPPERCVINCPMGCLTPGYGRLRRFYSLISLMRHCQDSHPEMALNLAIGQNVEINSQPVRVERRVIMLDEPIEDGVADMINDDLSTASTSSTISVLLEGDDHAVEVSVEDLCFSMGSILLLDDAGDSEDEKDA